MAGLHRTVLITLGKATVTVRTWGMEGHGRRGVLVASLVPQHLLLLLSLLLLHLLQLLPGNLFWVHGLSTAGGGMRIMGWSSRTFLGVLFLSPLGSAVLEPDLRTPDNENQLAFSSGREEDNLTLQFSLQPFVVDVGVVFFS